MNMRRDLLVGLILVALCALLPLVIGWWQHRKAEKAA